MAGIFGGIGDMITGGGGAPGFEGMSRPQRESLQHWQLANAADARTLLNDWWGMARNQYAQQQSMLPYLYGEMGVTPTYNEQGQVIGYQNTGPTTEQRTSINQEQATARLLGYNPVLGNDGRVDWNATVRQGGGTEDQLRAEHDQYSARANEQYNVGRQAQQTAYGDLTSGRVESALSSLQGQLSTADLLRNVELERLGIRSANGGYVTDPNSPEAQSRGLESQYLARAQQALQGTLPVDPGLQRQLMDEEQQLKNRLAAELGPGYASSTPGQQALADFAKRRTEILYNSQQDAANSGVANAMGLRQGNLASYDRLGNVGANSRQTAALLGNMGLSRNQALIQTAQMLQPMLQNQANATLAFQNARAGNTFKTLGAMYGANEEVANARQRTQNRLGGLTGAQSWANNPGDFGNIAALAGQLGSNNAALPWAQALWQGRVNTDNTNINNIWWRNFMQSAGSSTGQAAGSATTFGIGGAMGR